MKSSIFFSFCLILFLFSSCEPNLTDDVKRAYDRAERIDGNMWSSIHVCFDWYDALTECSNLTEGGYSDWRLPTISELRTLIKDCPSSQIGGSCAVKDPNCLSSSYCWNNDCQCNDYNDTGKYSRLGDIYDLISSSTLSDFTDLAWSVDFKYGSVSSQYKIHSTYIRCVR